MTRRTNVLSVGMIAVHLKASSYEHGYSIEKAFPREKKFISVNEIPLKNQKEFFQYFQSNHFPFYAYIYYFNASVLVYYYSIYISCWAMLEK